MKTTNETDERIEYALSNIRYAIRITDDLAVLKELKSAEHHLTREVRIIMNDLEGLKLKKLIQKDRDDFMRTMLEQDQIPEWIPEHIINEYREKNKHTTMKIGDTVNVKNLNTHWKGVIVSIRDRFNDKNIYSEPLAHVKGDGVSSATLRESKMVRKDGEWWEVKH